MYKIVKIIFYYYFSDKTIRVYKWQPGNKFSEVSYSPLEGHRYAINCITFSPFGTKLASASTDGSTIIWDVKVMISLNIFFIVFGGL